jgi:hypothetical protein
MSTLNFANLLSYGAIGLGCILAVLAYWLIRAEQRLVKPRRQLFVAVYVFMGFALLLSGFGFGSELWKDSTDHDGKALSEKAAELRAEIDKREKAISEVKQQNDQLTHKLATAQQALIMSQQRLKDLLDLKVGKVARLGHLQPGSRDFATLVKEIQRDLVAIDDKIAQVNAP